MKSLIIQFKSGNLLVISDALDMRIYEGWLCIFDNDANVIGLFREDDINFAFQGDSIAADSESEKLSALLSLTKEESK